MHSFAFGCKPSNTRVVYSGRIPTTHATSALLPTRLSTAYQSQQPKTVTPQTATRCHIFLDSVSLVAHAQASLTLGLCTLMVHTLGVRPLRSIFSRLRFVACALSLHLRAHLCCSKITGTPLSGQVSQSAQWAVSRYCTPHDRVLMVYNDDSPSTRSTSGSTQPTT